VIYVYTYIIYVTTPLLHYNIRVNPTYLIIITTKNTTTYNTYMHVGIDVAGKRRKPLAVIGDFNASDMMLYTYYFTIVFV